MSKKPNTESNIVVPGDRILVERKAVEQPKGGIYVPESAKEKPCQGIIKIIGTKVNDLMVGYEVYFPKFAGTELKIAGTDYVILKQEDVLVALRNPNGN